MSLINSIGGGGGFLNELRQTQNAEEAARQALKQLQKQAADGSAEGKAIDTVSKLLPSSFGQQLAEQTHFPSGAAGTPTPTFGNMLSDLVTGVDQKQKAAGEEAQQVMLGKSDNIHQAMIAMQEASVAFNLMVEVRNKLVESYKELSRMQV